MYHFQPTGQPSQKAEADSSVFIRSVGWRSKAKKAILADSMREYGVMHNFPPTVEVNRKSLFGMEDSFR
jgi:hypothetical protein